MASLKNEVQHALHTLADGWRALRDRASNALTHYTAHGEDESSTVGPPMRWSLLAAQVSADDDSVDVEIELPGLDKSAITIEVLGHNLVVRGEKRMERERRRGQTYVAERAYGAFQRTVGLPSEVDVDRAEATYDQGVLSVHLPKTVSGRSQRIKVSAA
jgi:HSP20 family protein